MSALRLLEQRGLIRPVSIVLAAQKLDLAVDQGVSAQLTIAPTGRATARLMR